MKDFKENKYSYDKPLRFKPIIIYGFFMILQIILIVLLFTKFARFVDIAVPIWLGLVFLFIVYLFNKDEDPDIKMSWILVSTLLPLVGILFYLLLHVPGHRYINKKFDKRRRIENKYKEIKQEVYDELEEVDLAKRTTAEYLNSYGYPLYKNTETKYLESGEEFFKELFEDLQRAEKFIFMEFFVISPGYILDKLTKILKQKSEEGVEIKFLFDGSNEFFLDTNFFQEFKESGIEVKPFLPVRAILSTIQQNRDHRKIVVIDNKISYTGGVNIADEYANIYEKNGHWVDTGIKLVGEGTKSFTAMFLEMWYLNSDEENYKRYLEDFYSANVDKKSFLVPFGVNPFLDERIGENVYIDIINRSKNYVYISTPYLTITNKMLNALKLASQRGVDVKIVLPHIGDHKGIPLMAGRSYYLDLIKKGVKIFEYKPGFIHSKIVVSDDFTSVIGTINMDYRSFYHHFEDGVLIYERELAEELKTHWEEIIGKSIEITVDRYYEFNVVSRFIGRILRLFASLM